MNNESITDLPKVGVDIDNFPFKMLQNYCIAVSNKTNLTRFLVKILIEETSNSFWTILV